ncbi:hypothetical protein [Botrimarina sp.]|uniref:hypothetical protein n=1 Tax=Botrimarina sp. TaxID=2795802 RepID=UPI0032EC9A2A
MPTLAHRNLPSIAAVCLLALGGPTLGAPTIDFSPTGRVAPPSVVRVDLRYEATATAEASEHPAKSNGQLKLEYRQAAVDDRGGRYVRVVDRCRDARNADPLGAHRRVLLAEPGVTGVRVAAAGAPLERSELDLVQPSADPLDLPSLAPIEPLADGGVWSLDALSLGRLMRLDRVTLCEVTGVVADANDRFALLKLAGAVHGLVDGASVEIDLRGAALFDRAAHSFTKANFAWDERRVVGPATPAIEARAKLNIAVRPLGPADEPIATAVVDRAARATFDPRLLITTGDGRWSLLADRDWFVVASGRDATTLRRVEGERIAAITTLTPRGDSPVTLESLRDEVRSALGDQLQQFTSGDRGANAAGLTFVEVTAVGAIDGRPAIWNRAHVAAGERAIALATTIASSETGADDPSRPVRELIETLHPVAAADGVAVAPGKRVR